MDTVPGGWEEFPGVPFMEHKEHQEHGIRTLIFLSLHFVHPVRTLR